MCSRSLRLVEVELRAPHDDVVAVVDVVQQHLAHPHHARHQAPGERSGTSASMITPNVALHRRVLVQLVQHHARNGVALELDDHAHAVAVGLVAQVADALELLVAHQVGDGLDEARLVHLVRQFGDDDLLLAGAFLLLDDGAGAHHDLAAPGLEVVLDALAPVDEAAGREVGTLDQPAQRRWCRSRGGR